jgi:regulator of protease activity HflC (stomatin/prohibitin superfamily)
MAYGDTASIQKGGKYQPLSTDDGEGSNSASQHERFVLLQPASASNHLSQGDEQNIFEKIPNIVKPLEGNEVIIPNLRDSDPDHPLLTIIESNEGQEYRPNGGEPSGSTVAGTIMQTLLPFYGRRNIRAGEVEISFDKSDLVILGPGLHKISDPRHETPGGTIKIDNREHIQLHDTLHIVTVPQGYLRVVCQAGRYSTLTPGRHVLEGPGWELRDKVSLNNSQIDLGSHLLITVPPKAIGVVESRGDELPLMPGSHVLEAKDYRFARMVNMDDLWKKNSITIGTIKIIWVPPEQNAEIIRGNGKKEIIAPGITVLSDPNSSLVKIFDYDEKQYHAADIEGLWVTQGEMGVIEDAAGNLKMLSAGRHEFPIRETRFVGFISTKQYTIQLAEMTVRTSDNVGMLIHADVSYKIENPEKVIKLIGNPDSIPQPEDGPMDIKAAVEWVIREKAKMTLNGLFQGISFAELSDTLFSQKSKKGKGEDGAEKFTQQISHKLHDQLAHDLSELGIHLETMGGTTFQIIDDQLRKDMEDQGAKVAATRAQVHCAQYENELKRTAAEGLRIQTAGEASSEAEKTKIAAEMEAQVSTITTQSDIDTMLAKANAEKGAKVIAAEGEAESIRIIQQAKTEARSKELEADAQFAELLEKNPAFAAYQQAKLRWEGTVNALQGANQPVLFFGSGGAQGSGGNYGNFGFFPDPQASVVQQRLGHDAAAGNLLLKPGQGQGGGGSS